MGLSLPAGKWGIEFRNLKKLNRVAIYGLDVFNPKKKKRKEEIYVDCFTSSLLLNRLIGVCNIYMCRHAVHLVMMFCYWEKSNA